MEQGFEDLHTETTHLSPDDETEGSEESNKGSGFLRFLRDIFETLILAAILFVAINTVSARIRVDGSSMIPTLHDGQFVMVNRWADKLGSLNHGDIVVFHYPRDPEQEYIKRIIGLAGDNIQIANGKVYVNDQELIEPYIAAASRSQGTWAVPAGHIFVLGDNRNNSQDSRSFGYVSMENVIGKAIFIYWPPTDWGLVTSPEVEASLTYP
jgi:signal peptidase I